LGGMGTRATWRFCQRLTDELDPKKEWDHPPMQVWLGTQIPSRTRAVLYGEASPVKATVKLLYRMYNAGVRMVAVPCNSIHFWRKEIMECLPDDMEWIDMISSVLDQIDVSPNTLVIGGYATMTKALYGGYAIYPMAEYKYIAQLLEKLRTGKGTDSERTVQNLVWRYNPENVLLACTELSLMDTQERPGLIPVFDSGTLYAKAVANLWKSRQLSSC